jgi:oligopeptide transport system substrate-binding protein
MPGYDASIGSQWEFNPTKAKQLLAEAGYPEGRGLPPVTFLAVATDAQRVTAQFIEDQLRRNLGIEVTTDYVDPATYGSRFTGNLHHFTIQRWGADWPYPDNWLPDLFGSGALNNHAVYRNARFDDLMRRAAAETDDEKRLQIYGEAHTLVIDEAAVSPLYNRDSYVLIKPKVKGIVLTPVDGVLKGEASRMLRPVLLTV